MPQTEVRAYRDAAGEVLIDTWLDELQASDEKAYAKCIQRIQLLSQLGNELRRPFADILRDGIRELRVRSGTVQYRILYFFSGSNRAVLSHGITKDGKVPDKEINSALKHKKLVENDAAKYTAVWDIPEA